MRMMSKVSSVDMRSRTGLFHSHHNYIVIEYSIFELLLHEIKVMSLHLDRAIVLTN